jgi:hypothetical protein
MFESEYISEVVAEEKIATSFNVRSQKFESQSTAHKKSDKASRQLKHCLIVLRSSPAFQS